MLLLLACSQSPKTSVPEMRLHAEGTAIVNAADETITLQGVNLGGWLFHETWITAVDYPSYGRFYEVADRAGYGAEALLVLQEASDPDDLGALEAALALRIPAESAAAIRAETEAYPSISDDSDLPLRQLLETRFGTDGRDALMDRFQKAWITEADVAYLSGIGLNVLRVPIGYRSLVHNSDLESPTDLQWNEEAFARIDDLLSWCVAHQMYAILDIQEAPGGQNDYSGPSTLYSDPLMQDLTVQLWEELSRRYRDHDEVAAYSLLAEPMGAPSVEASVAMYDRLVDAIRAQQDDHLLVIHDGFFGMETLPVASEMGWENVIYSTHFFEWGTSSQEEYAILRLLYENTLEPAQAQQNVPYFIGSFSMMVDEDWAYASVSDYVHWYRDHCWSWSLWTYKRIDDPIDTAIWGTQTAWGLRRGPWENFERPDVWRDSEAELLRKFELYNGEMPENTTLRTALDL